MMHSGRSVPFLSGLDVDRDGVNKSLRLKGGGANEDELRKKIERGEVSEVKRLIVDERADVNHKYKYEETPAYVASEEDQPECLKLLIENRADVNLARSNGRTPTYIACSNGHTECLTLLIISGADAQTPQTLKTHDEKTMMVHIKRPTAGIANALVECFIPPSDTSLWFSEIAAALSKGPLEMGSDKIPTKPCSVKDELKILLLTDELKAELAEEAAKARKAATAATAAAAATAEAHEAATEKNKTAAALEAAAAAAAVRDEELAKRAQERFEIRGKTPLEIARERGHAAAAAIVHIATLDETTLTTDELKALKVPGLLEVALSAAFANSALRTLERIADLVKNFRAEAYRVKRLDAPSGEQLMDLVQKAQQAAVGLLRALDDVGVDVKRLLLYDGDGTLQAPAACGCGLEVKHRGEARGARARMALVLAECKVTLADVMLQQATAAQWSLVSPDDFMDAAMIALRSVWHVAVIAVYPPREKKLVMDRNEEQKSARATIEKDNPEPTEESSDAGKSVYIPFKVDGKVVSSYWRKVNGSSDKRKKAARATFFSRRAELAEKKAERVLRLYPILQPAFKFYAWTSLQLLLAVLLTALPAERGKHITALLLVWTVQLAVLEAHEAYANRPLWAADPLNMYVHARASLSAHPRSVPWY